MTSRILLIASLAVFAAAPAYAFEPLPAPGPEAGASLGAMALVVTGYLALRRRIGR